MANIVLGLGTAHSPLMNEPGDVWEDHGRWELEHPRGIQNAYGGGDPEELIRRKSAWLNKEVCRERFNERFAAAQAALAAQQLLLDRVKPDVLVIVGDDQDDAFSPDNTPAMCVYLGKSVVNVPRDMSSRPSWFRAGAYGYYPEDGPEEYACEPDLALHLVRSLIQQRFDVAHLTEPQGGRHVGHAFTFIARRLLNGRDIPIVPFMLNTYFPPTQPTATRCYELGRAIRNAIENWESNKTVAVLASGGLSHPIVDVTLDQSVLALMEQKEEHSLTGMDEKIFTLGTSEIKNWVTVAGTLDETDLTMTVMDYIPAYRTTAGSGCGLAFAEWT